MANVDEDDVPGSESIRSELGRILASKAFRTSATQSRLLRYVVEKALDGQDIKAIHIVTELYGETETELHKAKSNANIVRGKLQRYYLSEGRDDLVRIDLPPGPGYRPTFSYNVEAAAIRALKRGYAAEADVTWLSTTLAEVSFVEAKSLAPNYAPIYEALAENQLRQLLLRHIFDDEGSPRPNAPIYGIKSALRAVELNPESWRGSLCIACLLALNYQWPEASSVIAETLTIDEKRVGSALAYAAYRVVIGQQEDGLEIVERNVTGSPQSLGGNLFAAFLFYLERNYEKATEYVTRTQFLVNQSDLREIVLALVSLETGKAWRAVNCLSRLTNTPQHVEYRRLPPLPGLAILCHVRAGDIDSAKEKWAIMRTQHSRKPLQFALAYMAFGRFGRAIVCLWSAYRQGDIFINCIHLLPIFDPLWKHPRFVQLATMFAEKKGLKLR